MARRLKTKVSPCSFRLNGPARQALAILEAEQPDKPRGVLIGELLIAKATGVEPPPTIQFAELDPADLFSVRGSIAEFGKRANHIKAAIRYATPGSNDEATSLGGALKQANTLLADGRIVLAKIREMVSRSASVKVEEIISFEDVYDFAVMGHTQLVKQFGIEEAAPRKAKMWQHVANFVRSFRPDVGPELITPTAFPIQKVATTQKIEGMEGEIGGLGCLRKPTLQKTRRLAKVL